MATLFTLQVYTQENKVLEEPVTSVILPGIDGYFGVLAYHAPLVAALGSGKLTIKRDFEEHQLQLSGGFVEVFDNTVTVLADSVSQPAEA
jgi:F-type H+-transporting ATPase subunit epsilon